MAHLDPWPFVIAAYIISGVAALALTLASFIAMTKAERAIENTVERETK